VPGVREHQPYNRPSVLPSKWEASPFLEQRPAARVLLLLLATPIPLPGRQPVFFSRWQAATSQSKGGTSGVEVTDTHTNTEVILKCLLHLMARCAWDGLAVVFEPLPHGFPQFSRVSMSAIVQPRFSLGAYFSQKSVGGSMTDLDTCERCRCPIIIEE
jgi:hypothetical protein